MVLAAAPTVADDAVLAAFGMPQGAAQAVVQVVEQALMVEPGPASQEGFAQPCCLASDPNDGLDAPDVEHEHAQRARRAVSDSGTPGR